VHLGVIAHVHEVAVEAVRPHGSDQRIYVRLARGCNPSLHQAVADELEVALELGDVRIRGGFVRHAPRVASGGEASRGLDTRGHEGELETQGLVGVAVLVGLVDRRQ